jgi:hypothetical protein
MGLQKELTLDNGIYLPEAYIKIISCNYICDYHTSVKVNIYKDFNAYSDDKTSVTTLTHICTDDFNTYFDLTVLNQENVNIISQSYEWLKTLEFYKDAIDVPEQKEDQ